MTAAQSLRPISQALIGAALLAAAAALAFEAGGYFHDPRTGVAIAAWIAVAAVALASGPAALVPPSAPGRVALAGLLALAGWTALSTTWAPLADPAREDAIRLALYAAVLPLAVFALGPRAAARATEPALTALALAVVGYGLLGEAGALDLAASDRAVGRLEQPLTYWNALGALAALGIVLAAAIALDAERPAVLRRAAALATAPLAAGLYLTYSRGALAALAVGLVVLAALAPGARGLRARLGRHGRLALGWAVAVAVAAGLALVVVDRATPPATGATAARLVDVSSDRADYWRVAGAAFADRALRGTGTGGFGVEWLREREVRAGAVDAHSLYLETAAELGVAGLLALAAFAGGVGACARRVARRDPRLAAGPCAALALLAFHAGIDWDWELPALALPGLALAGAVLAADRAAPSPPPATAHERAVAR